jgi:hypothetical protein
MTKSVTGNKPAHVVTGNILDALGFSTSEASALKVKAEIFSVILEHVPAGDDLTAGERRICLFIQFLFTQFPVITSQLTRSKSP